MNFAIEISNNLKANSIGLAFYLPLMCEILIPQLWKLLLTMSNRTQKFTLQPITAALNS